MGFAFLAEADVAESSSERLTWESQLLGLPVSIHPLATVARPSGAVTIRAAIAALQAQASLPAADSGKGRRLTVTGVRLPGWTGGPGFFLADEQCYVQAVGAQGERPPAAWLPIELTGQCAYDEWGGIVLHVERWLTLPAPSERRP